MALGRPAQETSSCEATPPHVRLARRSVLLPAAVLLALAAPAAGQLTLSAARSDLLYAQRDKKNPECSELHKITDDAQLPFYVARLRAVVLNPPAGQALVYRWSMQKKFRGILAADLDLGPAGENPAIAGMCAEFGNACILTADKLKFYNESSIFFISPGCDVLPKKADKPFRGGTSKVRLKVTAGRRKLGQATLTLAWGRNGAITLFVQNTQGNFENGVGKPGGVHIPEFTGLGATVGPPPNPEPPQGLDSFLYDGDFPTIDVLPGCDLPRFDSCVSLGLVSQGQGVAHAFATVEAEYGDGSALCDKIEVQRGPCPAEPKLEVIPKPKLRLYDPDDPRRNTVDLTVRLRNTSADCDFLLQGANVLSCAENLTVGGVEDSKTTQFDLKHCSQSTGQGCLSDLDCASPRCTSCQAGEICLTEAHCSKHFTRLCRSDLDCDPTVCTDCNKDETCVRVLDVPSGTAVFIPAGRSFDLLTETVTMRNELPDTAKIVDTWTANVFFPPATDEDTVKYRIRGRPKTTPAP